jgi:hypothetical protein
MTSPEGRDYAAEKYDAQLREADASLNALKAKAEARKAKADMDEISGLTAAREQVRKDIADFKKFAADDYAQTKRDAQQIQQGIDRRVRELQTRIERANERYSAWDEARERRFNARLDQAEAKAQVWKAQADQARAEDARDARNLVASVQEKTALARARAAEARSDRYTEKSRQALEDAARHFDQAYDAAVTRFETS